MRRLPAEWEAQSAIQITWPHPETDWAHDLHEVTNCYLEIARHISDWQRLLIACHDAELVRGLLEKKGCDLDNIVFCEVKSNDTWVRDYGALTILENEKPVLLDFIFNGWGQKYEAELDNLITQQLDEQGIFGKTPMRTVNFVLEGGAIETDGQGTLLATEKSMLSSNRNPMYTKKQIEDFLKQQFGFKRILWLSHGELLGDDTDAHIDTLARFADVDTILYVKCNDEDDEHYEPLKKMEEELQSFKTLAGKPYRLIPLPLPSPIYGTAPDGMPYRLPATYANFLITNNQVLVPIYNVKQDAEALKIIAQAFPDRKVIGINCLPLIKQHGSLHCITMQYPKGVTIR
ncbi:MAG: agmatine deiminase family protein [Cytophagales bacterium]|nr:agmatine deiminase family protein [Cytophagales bacterium]MDW8385058.1 agmatine deiminase family protein [Flammeovirgaceae bacterium]